MELIIQQGEEFTVKVDTEDRNFREGDIICGYVVEFPNFEDRDAPPFIPAHWFLYKVKSDKLGKFFNLVNKHYKVIEIL